MAGSDPTGNFNATAFRANIRATMGMALPNESQYQPTFRWTVKETFPVADPSERPYNWFAAPSSNGPAPIPDLAVPCAVQVMGDSSSGTDAGFINELNVAITMLDVDQAALLANGGGRMPDQVFLKGQPYNITYVPPPIALFSVDVWTIFAVAQDAA